MRRRAYWPAAPRDEAQDIQIIAVQPHIDQEEDGTEEREEGVYAAVMLSGQHKTMWEYGLKEESFHSVLFFFNPWVPENSQAGAGVGGAGVPQTAAYLYDNWWRRPGGWPVNGSGTNALFCLPRQSPSPAVSYGWQMDFDNARTVRMLSLVLTDHKSDLGRSITSNPDYKIGSVILCRHSERPLPHLRWVSTILAADALA